MKILRLLLSITVASWMTGVGQFALAQETNTSPFSITLSPVQYASVNGNVGKFRALNWMKDGGDAGISDIAFKREINKDTSLEVEGSAFAKTDNYDGHLVLLKGDLAFLQIDYKAFRKYYDGTGGIYPYEVITAGVDYGKIPNSAQGAQPNSPNLQMDISYFKLEVGLGPITDPFLDVAYEHNSKDGDKSLLSWGYAFVTGQSSTNAARKISPTWEEFNSYTDKVTLKEKKDIAGITFKADQKAEIDYNHSLASVQYLNLTTGAIPNELFTYQENPDAKLFGTGVRMEKWMLNDNTYAALGYHFNHTHAEDTFQELIYKTSGGITSLVANASTTPLNSANVEDNEHVWVANINTNLRPDLAFLADARYEHMGSEGTSAYYKGNTTTVGGTPSDSLPSSMDNHRDQTGEHISLRYSGLPHTTLYTEGNFEQERNWVAQDYLDTATPANSFHFTRLDRTQKESWTVGGRIVPNRFLTFTTQVRHRDEIDNYDTISQSGSLASPILLDSLRLKGIEETSTITIKPLRWLQNSLKYQFYDTVYNPRGAAVLNGNVTAPLTKNHMLTSAFTYDITVQPVDPLLLTLSYSHVENYVRTLAASEPGGANNATYPYLPTFNSGDNSWLFSGSYSLTENLTFTNSVSYTLSNNYVNFNNGVPYGSSFKELNVGAGVDWKYHKWLKFSPGYEYASYRDNSLVGVGTYSAHIFKLKVGFDW